MNAIAPGFVLDAQLVADTHVIGDFDLARALFMDDARFPWLILVPRRANLRELFDLNLAEQHQLLDETRHCAEALRKIYKPDKLNIAALGNVVAQLHVHLIARFRSDAAWPRPVWGVGEIRRYSAATLADEIVRLRAALRLAATT